MGAESRTARLVRHASLWLSLIHAVMVLILVPIAVIGQAWSVGAASVWGGTGDPVEFAKLSLADQAWRLCEALMVTEPSDLHRFISGFAGVYYSIDLILIWCNIHPLDLTLKLWYSMHHVLCFIGLTAPVFWYNSTWDMDLAYGGFFVGEISNPPRCVVDLLDYQIDTQPSASLDKPPADRFVTIFGRRYGVPALKRTMLTISHAQLALFIAFRFTGIQFFRAMVIPYAQYGVTTWMGGTTLALSLMAMVVMIQTALKPADTVPVALKETKKAA